MAKRGGPRRAADPEISRKEKERREALATEVQLRANQQRAEAREVRSRPQSPGAPRQRVPSPGSLDALELGLKEGRRKHELLRVALGRRANDYAALPARLKMKVSITCDLLLERYSDTDIAQWVADRAADRWMPKLPIPITPHIDTLVEILGVGAGLRETKERRQRERNVAARSASP